MISKKDAIKIAQELYGSRDSIKYTVYDYTNTKFWGYNTCRPEDLWCVTVFDNNKSLMFESSTIVLVHKKKGQIIYHGSGNDEG